jgi:hypothetical protein
MKTIILFVSIFVLFSGCLKKENKTDFDKPKQQTNSADRVKQDENKSDTSFSAILTPSGKQNIVKLQSVCISKGKNKGS